MYTREQLEQYPYFAEILKQSDPSALLDQLYGGTLVVVLSTRGEWARVRYNGTLGWVKTSYLVTSRK